MSEAEYDDRREESRPLPPESGNASPSRTWARVKTTIAMIGCGGVLWWTTQTVLTDNRAAKDAIRAMGSRNPLERVGAIRELEVAGLGDSRAAIPPLVDALGDSDARVRAAAAVALGPISTDAAASGSDREAIRATIMALLGRLKDPEPSVRVASANALMSLPMGGRPSIIDHGTVMAILVDRLADPDPETRLAVIRIMAALGPWAGLGPPKELIAALDDSSAGIRSTAVMTLSSFPRGLDPLIAPLFRMMESDDAKVGSACAYALDQLIRPPAVTSAAVPAMIAALGRPNVRVKYIACLMLDKLGPAAHAAVPALIVTAREPRIHPSQPGPRADSPDIRAISALGRIAPTTESSGMALAVLTELMKGQDPDKSRVAIDALGGFGVEGVSVVPDLIRMVKATHDAKDAYDPSPDAAEALGRIAPGTPMSAEALAALTDALRSNSAKRQSAIVALRYFGPSAASAIPELRSLANDQDLTTRSLSQTTLDVLLNAGEKR